MLAAEPTFQRDYLPEPDVHLGDTRRLPALREEKRATRQMNHRSKSYGDLPHQRGQSYHWSSKVFEQKKQSTQELQNWRKKASLRDVATSKGDSKQIKPVPSVFATPKRSYSMEAQAFVNQTRPLSGLHCYNRPYYSSPKNPAYEANAEKLLRQWSSLVRAWDNTGSEVPKRAEVRAPRSPEVKAPRSPLRSPARLDAPSVAAQACSEDFVLFETPGSTDVYAGTVTSISKNGNHLTVLEHKQDAKQGNQCFTPLYHNIQNNRHVQTTVSLLPHHVPVTHIVHSDAVLAVGTITDFMIDNKLRSALGSMGL